MMKVETLNVKQQQTSLLKKQFHNNFNGESQKNGNIKKAVSNKGKTKVLSTARNIRNECFAHMLDDLKSVTFFRWLMCII